MGISEPGIQNSSKLAHVMKDSDIFTIKNSVDPDQPADQDHQCFPLSLKHILISMLCETLQYGPSSLKTIY